MKISDFIRPENVFIDLAAPSKAKVLQVLAEKAGTALDFPDEAIFAALQHRENLGSTGIGGGVAIPHAPVAGLDRSYGCLARLAKPIAFDAIDDLPVDIIVVLLAPGDLRQDHLNALAWLARRLRTPQVLQALRAARTSADLHAVFADAQ